MIKMFSIINQKPFLILEIDFWLTNDFLNFISLHFPLLPTLIPEKYLQLALDLCTILPHNFTIKLRGHSTTTCTEPCHFWPPPPPAWTVVIAWAWTKTNIFDPLPRPHLVHVVIEWPIYRKLFYVTMEINIILGDMLRWRFCFSLP